MYILLYPEAYFWNPDMIDPAVRSRYLAESQPLFSAHVSHLAVHLDLLTSISGDLTDRRKISSFASPHFRYNDVIHRETSDLRMHICLLTLALILYLIKFLIDFPCFTFSGIISEGISFAYSALVDVKVHGIFSNTLANKHDIHRKGKI